MINLFPYTDAHELNLDWVVEQVKVNDTKVKDLTNTVINMHFDFDSKADKATTYTKTEVDTLLLTKANVSDLPDMSNYYDKTETDTLLSAKADSSSLASVATSGNYNDLTNKPTIPSAQVNSDWDAVSGVAQILNKPTLSTVATSGSYNDLNDKPTIPTAVKYVDKQYSNLSATTSNYYTKLADNVYTDLNIPNTSVIIAVTLTAFSAVNNSPISLGIDGTKLVWTHGDGHSFTNAIIQLRVAYL